jgi:hypothetical protein
MKGILFKILEKDTGNYLIKFRILSKNNVIIYEGNW